MSSPIDDIDFSGDKFLTEAAREQLDALFEQSAVETILKHFDVSKSVAANWCHSRYEDRRLICECLPEVAPQLRQRFTCVKLKFDTKRITTLSYDWLEKSAVGETVKAYDADQEPSWIITDLPIIPGQVVVGKRSFPLEIPFTGFVSANRDGECYLLCNLKQFLTSHYCDPV